jgi:hypothetical protein
MPETFSPENAPKDPFLEMPTDAMTLREVNHRIGVIEKRKKEPNYGGKYDGVLAELNKAREKKEQGGTTEKERKATPPAEAETTPKTPSEPKEETKEKETSPAQTPEPERKVEKEEIFSTDLIKEQIISLLSASERIKKVKVVRVEGRKNEVGLHAEIIESSKLGFQINIDAVLRNIVNGVGVKSYAVDANIFIRGDVDSLIRDKLKEVSNLLRDHIEKQKNRKVEKMEIVNGELKVTYK